MTDFAARVIAARANLAVDDPQGEGEANLPLPGSIAYWEAEIDRPLRGSQMDQQTAERIAAALEQIALELVARPLGTPLATSPTPHTGFVGNAALGGAAAWSCPVHGGSKVIPAGVSQRTGQAYQAFTVCAQQGCAQRPPRATGNQLP